MAPWTALVRIDPRSATDAERRELWGFVARYEEIGFDDFAARVADLSDVYVCRHPSGALGGVVAARITVVGDAGRSFTLVWGEWGFLDPAFRGRLMLERGMVRSVLRELCRRPLRPVYFMAEAATWKGYLALARGFGGLWPRPGHPLPAAQRTLADRVLARAGERDWDPDRGVFHRGKPIRFEQRAEPPRGHALYEFYARANPGQPDGDTLLCVAPVSLGSLLMMPVRTLATQLASGLRRALPRGARCVRPAAFPG